MENRTAVEMKNIFKSFGSLKALNDVSFKVDYEQIHAILGENGAGKSTLMSILFGMLAQDSGKIFVNGKEVHMKDANDATALKIGMVHQHFKLVNDFTVYENIVLGNEDTRLGFLKKRDAYKKIQALCLKYGINLSLDKKIRDVSVGMQQRTEIMKVLYRDADILIFDEPTAVLTPQEIDSFLEILKNFKKEGKAVILISHKLDEIKNCADLCTILRKGVTVGTYDVATTSTQEMADLMVGRQVSFKVDKEDSVAKEDVLEIKNLSCGIRHSSRKALDNVSFKVRAGEIVAIAGIEGNGQEELINLITGMKSYPAVKGAIHYYDVPVPGNLHELSKKEYDEWESLVNEYYNKKHDILDEKSETLNEYRIKIEALEGKINALKVDNSQKAELQSARKELSSVRKERSQYLSKMKKKEREETLKVEQEMVPLIKEANDKYLASKANSRTQFEKNIEDRKVFIKENEATLAKEYDEKIKAAKDELASLKQERKKTYAAEKKNFVKAYKAETKKMNKTLSEEKGNNKARKLIATSDRKAVLKYQYPTLFASTIALDGQIRDKKIELDALIHEKKEALMENKNSLKYLKNSGKQLPYLDLIRNNIKTKRNHKISVIPSDRQKEGLILNFTIADNLVITKFSKRPYSHFGILSNGVKNSTADRLIEAYDIRSSAGKSTRVGDMSGGNQQKVIIARETSDYPRLLIANQPTRGLDVGAIESINKLLIEQRDKGAAILLYSVELEDIMNLADRILVIHNGHIAAELDPKKTSFKEIGFYMGGDSKKEEAVND